MAERSVWLDLMDICVLNTNSAHLTAVSHALPRDGTDFLCKAHLDVKRAKEESPFKSTIAHGFLTLSLLSELAKRAMTIGGVRMAINYGLNRVRFVSPLPAGARIRARFALASLEMIDEGAQATWNVTVQREGSDKPCLIAEWLVRYYL